MEKVLLCIVAASAGLLLVSSLAEHQYHFVYDFKNWTEAQSYCREKYTDLATIENMEDMKILNDMYNFNEPLQVAWIGLHVQKWQWSLANEMLYSDGEADFRKWADREPDNAGNVEYCAFMNEDGVWGDYNCERTLPSVCSDVRGQNVTFVYTGISMSWIAAQSYCRAHFTDLASVRNMPENQKVKERIPSPGQKVWIGLFRPLWWSDGQIYSFHYFKVTPAVPEVTCVAADFRYSGKWAASRRCDWKRPFICYSTPVKRHVMKIRLDMMEPNSNLDMEDSAVMEGILKQLKQKLDKGGNKDIRLSWNKGSDGKVFHKVKKETRKKRNTNEEL